MTKYRQDEEQLYRLSTGGHKRWKRFFDEHLEPFQLFVMKYGKISREEAFAHYQEAMIILHRNIMSGKLKPPLKSRLQTYLFAVGKNLCRKNSGSGRLHFPEHLPEIPQNPMEEADERQHHAVLVEHLLGRINEKCREFLTKVFLEELSQEEIIEAMNIPSNEAFRKRKFDCLKKMRELINT